MLSGRGFSCLRVNSLLVMACFIVYLMGSVQYPVIENVVGSVLVCNFELST